VIVFHDVQDVVWFERIITHLHTQYHILSPYAFFTHTYDEKKINILITFDDGYTSWIRICTPVLASRNIHALFFINSGLVDVVHYERSRIEFVRKNLMLSSCRDTISWDDVRTLYIDGHTIGGHTVTHDRLSCLSQEIQEKSIYDDKARIENILACTIYSFAYPFGRNTDFNEVTIHTVNKAGYTIAFTTESAFVPLNGDMFSVPRLCIEDGLTSKELDTWIGGAYDIYTNIKNICVR
jgi:peptidoglycan/xylan/chitin deacetylase (PgdA/CDA1 family)